MKLTAVIKFSSSVLVTFCNEISFLHVRIIICVTSVSGHYEKGLNASEPSWFSGLQIAD